MVGWNKLEFPVIDPYSKLQVYIIDDRDQSQTLRKVSNRFVKTLHQKKVDLIYDLFEKYTNAAINSVRFPHGSTQATWDAYWLMELNSHSRDTLIIIYFHGLAGGPDKQYSLYVP